MMQLIAELQAERNALIAEIYAAFKGVTREGGVSWSETKVVDDYGSEQACLAARALDTDRSWIELATDDSWDAGPGYGGWAFLDAIGFRYYLPAAMVRVLRAGHKACSCFPLDFALSVIKSKKPGGAAKRNYTLEQWSLLDDRQCRCVARFVRLMIAWEESQVKDFTADNWRKAYERHWKQFE